MTALLWRDLRLAFRDPRQWLLAILFFLIFLSLFAIGLGGSASKLQMTASVAIWLALIFSLLLTFDTIFEADVQSGVFEQLYLSGISSTQIVVSKIVAGFAVSVAPLMLAIPLAGTFFQLSSPNIAGIMISVLFGAPALLAYGVLSGALLAGQKGTGFLAVLITLPFIVPVIIFALAGAQNYPALGIWNSEFQALIGLNLVAMAVSIPGAAAALSAYLD